MEKINPLYCVLILVAAWLFVSSLVPSPPPHQRLEKDEYYVVVCIGLGYGEAHLFTDPGDNDQKVVFRNGTYYKVTHQVEEFFAVTDSYTPKDNESCEIKKLKVIERT